MSVSISRPLAATVALFLLSACDDPLKRAQDLDEPRVLGATVHVVGDRTRAEPSVGESVDVEFVAGAPDPLQPFGWAFEVCWAKLTSFGVGECEAAPFASFTSDVGIPAPKAELSFTVPTPSDAPSQPHTLLIRGAFCPTSGASLEDFPEGVRCEDASDPLPAELRVTANPTTPNHNPTIESVLFDGMAWNPLPPNAGTACDSLDAPRVKSGSGKHELTLWFADAARETLATSTARQPSRESLLISHFSTLGKLARRYSALAPDEANGTISVLWEAPAAVAFATPARFFLFARDLRGGADLAELSLCVEPTP